MSQSGDMKVDVDGVDQWCHLKELATDRQLWAVFDVCYNTVALEFTHSGRGTTTCLLACLPACLPTYLLTRLSARLLAYPPAANRNMYSFRPSGFD